MLMVKNHITKQLHVMTIVHILQSQQKGQSPDVYEESTAPQVKKAGLVAQN